MTISPYYTRYYAYDVEGTRIKTQKGEDTTKFVYNVNARLSQLLVKTENNTAKFIYNKYTNRSNSVGIF